MRTAFLTMAAILCRNFQTLAFLDHLIVASTTINPIVLDHTRCRSQII